MKQYKLVIKENFSENLSGIVVNEAKGGWRLNSCERNEVNYSTPPPKGRQQQVVLVFEK